MKLYGFVFVFLFFISSVFAGSKVFAGALSLDEKIELAKSRCAPQLKTDPTLKLSTFKAGQSVEAMDALFEEVYNSPERLPDRVGYHPGTGLGFASEIGTKREASFPEAYIKSVIQHIEKLLKLSYIKYVFYSDLGHSHFFIPMDFYNKYIRGKDYGAIKSAALAMNSQGLKTLYHTAEQLQFFNENKKPLENRYVQWRFHTRNPVLDREAHVEILTDFTSKVNTVRDYFPNEPAYRYFVGFYISANQAGCFPYEEPSGEIKYFDLSFSSPGYDVGQSGGSYL